MIAGIEMFLGVAGKQVGMEMTEYQMAANSIEVTRRLERNVDSHQHRPSSLVVSVSCRVGGNGGDDCAEATVS